MSDFYESVLQGLKEAVAIKRGELELVEIPNMPAPTYKVPGVSGQTTTEYETIVNK